MEYYTRFLNEELDLRRKRNASYSLRAFARDLGLSGSQMSNLLKEKIGLSTAKADHICNQLKLSSLEKKTFISSVQSLHGRSVTEREQARKYLLENEHDEGRRILSGDEFQLISNPLYFMLLSMMELDDYDGSLEFLSEKSQKEIEVIEGAIVKLIRLKLVEFRDDSFCLSGEQLTTSQDIASRAIRESHKEKLYMAIDALDCVDRSERDITSMTMAIDKNKIPEAKELIKEFRRKLCSMLEHDEKNDVYTLNIQLHPLTGIPL